MRVFRRQPRVGWPVELSVLFLALYAAVPPAAADYQFERMWPLQIVQTPILSAPKDIEFDREGNLVIADYLNARIVKTDKDGRILFTWGSSGSGPGKFNTLSGIAVGPDGSIFVTEGVYGTIQKYTSTGIFLSEFGGGNGTGPGQFDEALYIAAGPGGLLYITDKSNHRVQVFDDEGNYITNWGSFGTGPGQFSYPAGICVANDGSILVADVGNHRIQRFSSDGTFLQTWGTSGSGDGQFQDPYGITQADDGTIYVTQYTNQRVQYFDENGTFLGKWGSSGVDEGEFSFPVAVAVVDGGSVYVADQTQNRIQKFTSSGTFLLQFGTYASGSDGFNDPRDVAVAGDGSFYVVERGGNQVQKFDSSGQFELKWGTPGTGDGQLGDPSGIDVGPTGSVYVAEDANDRVQVFDEDGVFITKWGSGGSGDGQFNGLRGIAVSGSGLVYTIENSNHRVQKFDDDGDFVTKWGSFGTGNSQFRFPTALAVAGDGSVYVADSGNNEIKQFDSDGVFIRKWGGFGFGSGLFNTPDGIAVGSNGNVYVFDSQNSMVQIFESDGDFVEEFGEQGYGPGEFSQDGYGIAVDASHAVFAVDTGNNRVQKYKPITAPTTADRAVFVIGGGSYPDNTLWPATLKSATLAYVALQQQGFSDEQIIVLGGTNLNLDNDPDFEGDMISYSGGLEYVLTYEALQPVNGLPIKNAVIYLVDHGGNGNFRMNEDGDILQASDLGAWVDTFHDGIPGHLTFVYDACESGSFQASLNNPTYASRRTLAFSASQGEEANFVLGGSMSFSNPFWVGILNGVSVGDAFAQAQGSLAWSLQTPQLFSDGNGTANESGDFTAADTVFLGAGNSMGLIQPSITNLMPDEPISGVNDKLIWVDDVTDADGIASVWAVITPPSYQSAYSTMAVIDRARVDLLPAGGDRYEGTYEDFVTAGVYSIDVFAMDSIGQINGPVHTTLTVGTPPTRKAIIVRPQGATEQALNDAAQWAYSALKIQAYSDSDIHYLAPAGDSDPGKDADTSLANLQSAITGWGATNTRDLTVIIAAPGVLGGLQVTPSEFLAWQDLDAWLDTAQSSIPGIVTVVCDASGSGSMLGTLADSERFLAASSGAGQEALFEDGASFSLHFWIEVTLGATLGDAFTNAASVMNFASGQQAQLDDNFDGYYDTKTDGARAFDYSLGTGIALASDEPIVGGTNWPMTIADTDTTATIEAWGISSLLALDKVVAIVDFPDGRAPVELELVDDGFGTYQAELTGMDPFGIYAISVIAVDIRGIASDPADGTITKTNPSGINPDAFESDDSASEAAWVGVNAFPDQAHTFHEAGDEDWVVFPAVSGETFTVETNRLGIQNDTAIQVFEDDGTTLVGSADDRGLGDVSTRFVFTAGHTGLFYARVYYSSSGSGPGFGEGTEYELRVWKEVGPAVPGSMLITVLDTLSQAVPGANVTVNQTTPFWTYQLLANASGQVNLAGLEAGQYSISATATGYTNSSPVGVTVFSGSTATPNISMQMLGRVQTTLLPAAAVTAGAQWKLSGEGSWRNSGDIASGLSNGQYTVVYKDTAGWITPASENVNVTAGNTTSVTGTYVKTGSLQVSITPSGAVTAGAQWRVDGGAWQNSGATVTNLAPGAHTVSFNTVAGWNSPSNITTIIVSDQTTQESGAYTLKVGSLSVTLSPAGAVTAGAKWRVDGGAPQNSGATVSGLPIGDHTVSFDAIANWDAPANKTVTISEGATTNESGTYVQHTGSISITINPAGAVTAGAQWAVDGGAWQNSGATVSGLTVGSHTVTFKNVAGWDTPSDISATITKDQTTSDSGTYVQQTGSLSVTILPAEAVTEGAQWQVDGGPLQNSGATVTGLPVGAHTISFTTIADWAKPGNINTTITKDTTTTETGTYTRDTGSLSVTLSPPEALTAGAGWQVDGGDWNESGDTVNGLSTGSHVVTFRAVDHWEEPAALNVNIAKDATTNEAGAYVEKGSITTTIEPAGAITAGAQWRVDGGAWQNSGATVNNLAPGSHTVQFKPVTDWTTPGDQNVTVTSGEDEPVTGNYVQHTGSIIVNITPAEAVTAGAQWKLDAEATWRNTGTTATGVAVGNHAISFKSVDGWVTPTVQLATVTKDQVSTNGGTYVRATIAKPTNLQASDGTFTDKVQLTWTGVAGAASYKIFRASTWNGGEATTIGTTSGTTYDDFTAAAPSTTPPPSGGCGGSGGPGETNYVLYIYWVQALGAGGIESDWCDPNDGYRGGTAKLNDWFDAPTLTVYERALPSAMLDDGTRAARPNDSLAVRMRADDAIDATSLRVTLDGVPADDVTVEWMPVGNEANDGWAVVRHTSEWPVGTTITLSAEATTDAGEVHQSDTIIFTIVPQDTVLSDPPAMDNALGETYITEATGPFATPLEIRIPVPESQDPSTLNLYYYLVDGENAGWHPVENVQGLMNNEPQLVNNEWVLQINHGATMSVGVAEASRSEFASAGIVNAGSRGGIVVFCIIAGLLVLTAFRMRRAI